MVNNLHVALIENVPTFLQNAAAAGEVNRLHFECVSGSSRKYCLVSTRQHASFYTTHSMA